MSSRIYEPPIASPPETEYEWVQHQEIARLIGIDEEKIRAIADDEITESTFDSRELLTLRLARHVLEDEPPPAELVTETEGELGRAALIDVLIVTGYYAMLGGLMRGGETRRRQRDRQGHA
jgi:hypothetical protein